MEKIKVINLFRLARRLEENNSKHDLYQSFERLLYDQWEFLTPKQKSDLECIHSRLKDKYLDSLSNDKQHLFGVSLI